MMIGGCLLLILGFLAGSVFPQRELPWSVEDVQSTSSDRAMVNMSTQTTDEEDALDDRMMLIEEGMPSAYAVTLNQKDNFYLLDTACTVLKAIQQRDYVTLSTFVDPERGVTITPYSTVNVENDLNFTQIQVRNFDKDTTQYSWGRLPGKNDMIQMTASEFIANYLFSSDYTQAPRISLDRINISGNALENVEEAYPGCRFVDFAFPGSGRSSSGQDWSSLKLVFAPGDQEWRLVGLIHSQWTA